MSVGYENTLIYACFVIGVNTQNAYRQNSIFRNPTHVACLVDTRQSKIHFPPLTCWSGDAIIIDFIANTRYAQVGSANTETLVIGCIFACSVERGNESPVTDLFSRLGFDWGRQNTIYSRASRDFDTRTHQPTQLFICVTLQEL